MKKTIRLTESKLISLVKRIIKESNERPQITDMIKTLQSGTKPDFSVGVTYNGEQTYINTDPIPGKDGAYTACITGMQMKTGGSIFDDATKGPNQSTFSLPDRCQFKIYFQGKDWSCGKGGCFELTNA